MEALSQKYRDKGLKEVFIKVTPFSEDYGSNVSISIEVIRQVDPGEQRIKFGLCWSGTEHDSEDTSIVSQTMLLIKWAILNNYLKRLIETNGNNEPVVIYRKDGSVTPQRDAFFYTKVGEHYRILLPAIEEFRIQEHRLARRIVLHLLYWSDSLLRQDIINQAHFDTKIVEQEVVALLSSDIVKMHGKQYYATLAARELYESETHSNQGIVFIVAACHADNVASESDHQKILKVYQSVVSREFSLTPIFQENEEPQENIYTDIFNYLDKCDFVIADITYDRPNCYVEIGYALAKGKHVLGFKQKEWSESKKPGNSIPFDLFPIRFLDYAKGNSDDLEEKLRERIRIIVGRFP